MKKMLIMTCVMALSFSLGLTGCNRAELKNLRDDLAKTKREKDAIEAEKSVVTQARNQLQKQVEELNESRDQLQAQLTDLDKLQEQVKELTVFRGELQKQNDELTQSRDAAAAEAQTAQLRIDELAKKLEAETEKVRVLQDQLKQVQAAITELQGTLKL